MKGNLTHITNEKKLIPITVRIDPTSFMVFGSVKYDEKFNINNTQLMISNVK